MDSDLSKDSRSGRGALASSGLQDLIERLVGPLHDRRTRKDRRQVRRIPRGRRHTD
jgi:hypothetical protein